MSIQKKTLANGVRVLVEPVGHVRSAAIGLWCATGSRHENDHEAGITHLIEHMLFKGTPTRNAKQIAESIEGRGGILNAFTDKEQTCYYCRTLSDDAQNGIEVLSDMMTHSLLDPEELGRERHVVLEEIKRSEDEPESHVHELHIEGRWGNHPLGKPIIGTRESVSGFQSENLRSYIDRRYRGNTVVLAVCGNVEADRVFEWGESVLGQLTEGGDQPTMTQPLGSSRVNQISKDVEQVHFCIGGDACAITSPEIYPLKVLDAILGGGMSSRLFHEIRERRGLAYSVGSYTLNYSSGGALVIYGGTGQETWEQVRELVRTEVDRLVHDGLEDGELDRIKRSISGQIVLGLEGMNARMNRMARNEIVFGRDIPIEETLAKLNAVTEAHIRDLAAQILAPEAVSTTAIGPF